MTLQLMVALNRQSVRKKSEAYVDVGGMPRKTGSR
jgi:hypothetical protein